MKEVVKVYAVLAYIAWDKVEVDGKKLIPTGLGVGFLPIFDSEEVARKKYPNHEVISIEMEVEVKKDDVEVHGRAVQGDDDVCPYGSFDL